MVESLEGRQLFSTVHPAGLFYDGLSPTAVAATVVLTKSQVIGNYKGSATTSQGAVIRLKLLIRATSLTLTVTGYGTVKVPLSAHKLNALRDGTFSFSATVSGETLNLAGNVTNSGARIAGNFAASGNTALTGTYVLKKY